MLFFQIVACSQALSEQFPPIQFKVSSALINNSNKYVWEVNEITELKPSIRCIFLSEFHTNYQTPNWTQCVQNVT
jgi:hypothetical protein